MFCTKCGTKLDDAARFCTACGTVAVLPPVQHFTRLRRIGSRKRFAGVCAGYAEYFDMDLTLMRLIWIALTIIPPHIGLIAYVVSWFVLSSE